MPTVGRRVWNDPQNDGGVPMPRRFGTVESVEGGVAVVVWDGRHVISTVLADCFGHGFNFVEESA